ncbi:MAG TPA: hypothetical protein DEP46_09560, partial [Blastocatellia bacterium]|nr:hypothetical protein [Blastocatellia bacterium]
MTSTLTFFKRPLTGLNAKYFHIAMLAILVAFSSISGHAQAESGSAAVEGTVTDANGAAVAGASVRLRNAETGLERNATSDVSGRFSARVLPVGRYEITVTASGFAEGRQQNVQLRVGEATPVAISLRPSEVTAEVEVTSGTDIIDSETSTTGASISERLVSDLPVRGRNFTEFVTLTPAVVQEADRSGLVIAGQ